MAKIMLVEDDKSLREIYGVRLAAEGYQIISAGDGEEALAMAVKEKPDLILSDVMMPKISGFDMLDIIRATPETKDLKIIMMTALSSEDQRARGESLGANKYLVKSQVGIEDVVRAVHEVIGDMPMAVGPKPVEFTTPVATETIETKPEVEITAPTQEIPTNTPPSEVVTPPVLAPEPVASPEPVPAPPAPQESSLPQPTAPFTNTTSINPAPTVSEDAPQVSPGAPQPTPTIPAPPSEVVTPPVLAPEPVASPEPVPAPPVPQESSLPQPTAPFSTAAPRSSIGERVINPLNSVEETPDISSLMNQELNSDSNIAPPPQL